MKEKTLQQIPQKYKGSQKVTMNNDIQALFVSMLCPY